MPSRTPKRTGARPPVGKACTVCGKPILAAVGIWHASCSHRCVVCYDPVMSTDPTNNPKVHLACSKKRAAKR